MIHSEVADAMLDGMSARERPIDRGLRVGRATLGRVGDDLRSARHDRSLSIDAVARTLGISNAEISRIERGLSPKVPFLTLARFAAAVGLDLSARLYPGGPAIRDVAQIELLGALRAQLHRSLRWATEVALPLAGDQRAWDATISGTGWSYGAEAEGRPRDAQALVRRINLKVRDSPVDGALLVLRDTRATREFVRIGADELQPAFPVPGWRALELLRAGANPGGSAMVLLPLRVANPVTPLRLASPVTPLRLANLVTPHV